MDIQRTEQQNRALHKWFELLADALNDAGLDQRIVLKETIPIPWAKESIKEQIWRRIQKAIYNKNSTKDLLKKEEIDKIYDTINKHLSEKFKVDIPPFPNMEDYMSQ